MSFECPCCGRVCRAEDSLGYHLYSKETKDDMLTFLHNRGVKLDPMLPKNYIVKQVVAKVTEAPMKMQSRTPGIFPSLHRGRAS